MKLRKAIPRLRFERRRLYAQSKLVEPRLAREYRERAEAIGAVRGKAQRIRDAGGKAEDRGALRGRELHPRHRARTGPRLRCGFGHPACQRRKNAVTRTEKERIKS